MATRVTLLAVLVACALFFTAGCNEQSSDVTNDIPQVVEKPKSHRPTTQQLLDSKRKTSNLESLPLTIDLPESWKVRTRENKMEDDPTIARMPITSKDGSPLVYVEGPMPVGDAVIQISEQPSMTVETLKYQFKNLEDKKPMYESHGGTIKKIDDQDIVRVEEHSPIGPELLEGGRVYDWRVTLYIKGPLKIRVYQLSFIGLGTGEYAAGQAMLHPVVDSFKYARDVQP